MEDEIVVLTGAAGCLGHHVLKLLVSRDEQVKEIRCLDVREPQDSMKRIIDEEIANCGSVKKIKWIKGDVRDINVVEQTLTGAHCIIHCAAKIDIMTEPHDQDEAEMVSINIGGTENLLRAAVRLGVYKFIHVSSFEIYAGFNNIYYATEGTLPDTTWHLFGPSGWTKKEAERKVIEYNNKKLHEQVKKGKDSLNVIVVRSTTIYGEFDRHFVSKILEATKFLGGTLRRMDFVWVRQQPIYAGNLAWALIVAKQRMDIDQTISGEEFHITDDTSIGDPFDFVEPYLECKGMQVTKSSYPFLPVVFLLAIFFVLKRFIRNLDIFGLFTTNKKRRPKNATGEEGKIEENQDSLESAKKFEKKHWYDYVTPQTLCFMCYSSFLNRTKASLRLKYDPIFDRDESRRRSIEWYKNHLKL